MGIFATGVGKYIFHAVNNFYNSVDPSQGIGEFQAAQVTELLRNNEMYGEYLRPLSRFNAAMSGELKSSGINEILVGNRSIPIMDQVLTEDILIGNRWIPISDLVDTKDILSKIDSNSLQIRDIEDLLRINELFKLKIKDLMETNEAMDVRLQEMGITTHEGDSYDGVNEHVSKMLSAFESQNTLTNVKNFVNEQKDILAKAQIDTPEEYLMIIGAALMVLLTISAFLGFRKFKNEEMLTCENADIKDIVDFINEGEAQERTRNNTKKDNKTDLNKTQAKEGRIIKTANEDCEEFNQKFEKTALNIIGQGNQNRQSIDSSSLKDKNNSRVQSKYNQAKFKKKQRRIQRIMQSDANHLFC